MKNKYIVTFYVLVSIVCIAIAVNCLIGIYCSNSATNSTVGNSATNSTVEANGYSGLDISAYPVKDPAYYENSTEIFSTKVDDEDLTVVRGYASPIKISVPQRSALAEISFKNSSENLPKKFTLCWAELWHMTVPRSSDNNNLMEIVFAEQNEKFVIVNMTVFGKDASRDCLPVAKVLSREDKERLSLH